MIFLKETNASQQNKMSYPVFYLKADSDSSKQSFQKAILKPRMWMSRNPACDTVHGELQFN
jgi:hypothetical protein